MQQLEDKPVSYTHLDVYKRQKHTQSSQMVGFIERVAKNERTNKNNIFVNSTQLADGVIVKIKGDYYKVNLSACLLYTSRCV